MFCETVDNFVDKGLRLPDVAKKVRLTVMLVNQESDGGQNNILSQINNFSHVLVID